MLRAIVLSALLLTFASSVAADTYAWERDGTRPTLPVLIECRIIELDPQYVYQGVAHDGFKFRFSRSGDGGAIPPAFEDRSEQGTFLDAYEQEGVFTHTGLYDLTWCGTHFWGSECWWLRGYNATGLLQGYWYANNPPYQVGNPVHAICYAETNKFYVGGWGTHVYRGTWGGGWQTQSTTGWQQITPTIQNSTSGIALDTANNALYLSDYTDRKLYQLDPDGGPVLGEIPLFGLGYGPPRGCCMAETSEFGSALAILFGDPGGRFAPVCAIFTLDYTPVERGSWGKIKERYREE